jgi:cell division septation protein DedD
VAESHEPSYYEIALTNRQVIVAFVILLVCLLSAFFSGLWIGRESTVRAAGEQMVRNAPPAAAQEGQNLEELEFFGSRNQPGEGKAEKLPEEESTPQPSNDTTLVEDFGGARPQEDTPAAEPEEPAPDDQPAAAAGETGEAAPERRGRRNRAAEEAAPAVPKGSVVIQVFSSAERSQAERQRERLVGGGYQAYLSPVEVGGHTMYRVRIGPFPSRAVALKVAEQVRKGYKLDTWVTE